MKNFIKHAPFLVIIFLSFSCSHENNTTVIPPLVTKEYSFDKEMNKPLVMRYQEKDNIKIYQSENFIAKYGDKSSNFWQYIETLKNIYKVSAPEMTSVLYYENSEFKVAYDGRYFSDEKTLLISDSKTHPHYDIDNLIFHEVAHTFQAKTWDFDNIANKNKGGFQWLIEGQVMYYSFNTEYMGSKPKVSKEYIVQYTKDMNIAYGEGYPYSLKGIIHFYEMTELGSYNYGIYWGFAEFIAANYGIDKFNSYETFLRTNTHEESVKLAFGETESEVLAKFEQQWGEFFY